MARKFLNIGRGVRQDYSLPPYLFILSVEVLAKAIRRNKKNQRNTCKSRRKRIKPVRPDDTTQIPDGARESLSTLLFGKVSGLNLNSNKTGSLWIAVPDPHPEIKEGGGGGGGAGAQKTFLGSKNKRVKGFRTPPLDPPMDWLKHWEKRDSCS